jgi:hypothetical protein
LQCVRIPVRYSSIPTMRVCQRLPDADELHTQLSFGGAGKLRSIRSKPSSTPHDAIPLSLPPFGPVFRHCLSHPLLTYSPSLTILRVDALLCNGKQVFCSMHGVSRLDSWALVGSSGWRFRPGTALLYRLH